jgi:hypothetical protein
MTKPQAKQRSTIGSPSRAAGGRGRRWAPSCPRPRAMLAVHGLSQGSARHNRRAGPAAGTLGSQGKSGSPSRSRAAWSGVGPCRPRPRVKLLGPGQAAGISSSPSPAAGGSGQRWAFPRPRRRVKLTGMPNPSQAAEHKRLAEAGRGRAGPALGLPWSGPGHWTDGHGQAPGPSGKAQAARRARARGGLGPLAGVEFGTGMTATQ